MRPLQAISRSSLFAPTAAVIVLAGARLSGKPTAKRPSHDPRTESTESARTVHGVAQDASRPASWTLSPPKSLQNASSTSTSKQHLAEVGLDPRLTSSPGAGNHQIKFSTAVRAALHHQHHRQ
ncbi:hypothetical protein BDP55DRAFT_409674 [Colletotrichum godetiae]|uniref:Uncharacterized protein n=1 Tax=Colletotrichum godetiae TaxID=1209918 RepID=A0AAJ0ASB7_9PEZI|nr:uncharacterized protein BDP55DRAFT_409674 [Colletotrichum godetiae]KAK1689481.1 hypothetical protein BDP55DRAFT_409674 [Colletotrichum godetiae]